MFLFFLFTFLFVYSKCGENFKVIKCLPIKLSSCRSNNAQESDLKKSNIFEEIFSLVFWFILGLYFTKYVCIVKSQTVVLFNFGPFCPKVTVHIFGPLYPKFDPHNELDNLISTELDNPWISTELDSQIATELDNCQISTES